MDNPWNIRCWFVPEGQKELTLTKSGIALREKLKTAMILVEEILHGELDKVSFCEKTYQNQKGALTCSNCNQNDFMNHWKEWLGDTFKYSSVFFFFFFFFLLFLILLKEIIKATCILCYIWDHGMWTPTMCLCQPDISLLFSHDES